jgi:predicted AlkP superfamily phosphohydrolase/phosphomutase
MRRSLLSATLAAALFASHIVLLTLYLNPGAGLRRDGAALTLVLFVPYLLAGIALLGGVAAATRALSRESGARRPPIEGLPYFTTLAFTVCATSALLFWTNLWSYRHSIPEEYVRALAASSIVLSGCALIFVAVGVDVWLFPFRGRGVSSALVVLSALGSLVVPLAARPDDAALEPAKPAWIVHAEAMTPTRRVILVGADGLGPDLVRDGVERGTLPAFAYLLRHGAHGPLATLRPSEGPPVWTSILTGVLPRAHGVKSFVTYRLRGSSTVFELLPKGVLVSLLERWGLVSTEPVTSAARRRPAIWNALNAFAVDAGLVRLWATHPVEPVRGFMLSPRLHQSSRFDNPLELLHPPDLMAEVRAHKVEGADVDRSLVSEFIDLSAPADPRADELRRELVEDALAPDLTYRRAGTVLRAAYDPPFFATYFYGLDVVGHAFLPYARPGVFGNVDSDAARRYGRVIPRYVTLLGEWVMEAVEHRQPSDVVIFVSGFGMEPATPLDRLVALVTGRGPVGGVHDRAPDGYFIAVGDGIRPGATLRAASVVDVAPTILYLMGLPVARDLDGRVLTEILDEDFARAHPLTFIPSYGGLATATPEPPTDLHTEDGRTRERVRSR